MNKITHLIKEYPADGTSYLATQTAACIKRSPEVSHHPQQRHLGKFSVLWPRAALWNLSLRKCLYLGKTKRRWPGFYTLKATTFAQELKTRITRFVKEKQKGRFPIRRIYRNWGTRVILIIQLYILKIPHGCVQQNSTSTIFPSEVRVLWDDPMNQVTWVMVRQRNRRIHSKQIFIGSFEAPWSDWSWIIEPDPDHRQRTHRQTMGTMFSTERRLDSYTSAVKITWPTKE